MHKYQIKCHQCSRKIDNMNTWLLAGQACPSCECKQVSLEYTTPSDNAFFEKAFASDQQGIWRYKDRLPLADTEFVQKIGEPSVSIERWPFLEEYAQRTRGLDIEVWAHRYDESVVTGTFKDLAASVIANVLSEQAVPAYVAASTGNFSMACAHYLKRAGIDFHAFLPASLNPLYAKTISSLGQHVHPIDGDYAAVKLAAAKYSKDNNLLGAAGTLDPMRLEAKKTIAYEWARLMPHQPTVYIQAVSGGTGPIGVHQGCADLMTAGLFSQFPRFLLVQTDTCSPMVDAWNQAESNGFQGQWHNSYTRLENPESEVLSLTTGNPTEYPVLAKLVHMTGGAFMQFAEKSYTSVIAHVARSQGVCIGPAAAVAVGGCYEAILGGQVRNKDKVVVIVGEGLRYNYHLLDRLPEPHLYPSNIN